MARAGKITHDEWTAELERLGALGTGPDAEGFTNAEYANRLGLHLSTAHSRIAEMLRKGMIRVAGRRKCQRPTDGVAYHAPVYAVSQPAKAKA